MVALEAALQFEDTRESMQSFCVGQYMEVPTVKMHSIILMIISYYIFCSLMINVVNHIVSSLPVIKMILLCLLLCNGS